MNETLKKITDVLQCKYSVFKNLPDDCSENGIGKNIQFKFRFSTTLKFWENVEREILPLMGF